MQQLHLFGGKPKCHCQRHQLLVDHPQYDLVKKCRQCRRIIRDYPDSDSEQSGSEFCECLLQNTMEREEPREVAAGDSTGQNANELGQEQDPLDRCESQEVLDSTGLPSYRTAAKLGLMACD